MKKLLNKKYVSTASVVCPACQSKVDQVHYVYSQDNYYPEIFSCSHCTFMFSRPVLIEEMSDRPMESVEDADMFGSPLMKKVYVEWFLKREMREVRKKTVVDRPRLLDVGCGTGWTTSFWRENGFDVQGLEPSKVRSRIAEERYGLKIDNDYLELYQSEKLYDVVVMRHSLEHFEDPAGALSKINSLLDKDGVVLLVVPNIDCLGRRLFGTDWEWVLPWHCNFFNPNSLQTILNCAGFDDTVIFQTPSPLYLMDSLGRKLNTISLAQFRAKHGVASMLLSAPFALIGSLLGMGDNVTAVARKTALRDSV